MTLRLFVGLAFVSYLQPAILRSRRRMTFLISSDGFNSITWKCSRKGNMVIPIRV
jgi:hypothetical protein